MSDTPIIASLFNACQHKGYCLSLHDELSHLNERLIAQHEGDLTERESYWCTETVKARLEVYALKAQLAEEIKNKKQFERDWLEACDGFMGPPK